MSVHYQLLSVLRLIDIHALLLPSGPDLSACGIDKLHPNASIKFSFGKRQTWRLFISYGQCGRSGVRHTIILKNPTTKRLLEKKFLQTGNSLKSERNDLRLETLLTFSNRKSQHLLSKIGLEFCVEERTCTNSDGHLCFCSIGLCWTIVEICKFYSED